MLITHKNTPIQIATKSFASGGEGAVYHILEPKSLSKQIVKILKPSKRTPEREEKMKYMLAHLPAYANDPSNALIWVKELVYEDGKFVGYTMDMAKGVKLEYLCGSKIAKSIGKDYQKYDFKYKEAYFWRLKVAFSLAVAVVQLHQTNQYVAVDLKPDNIIVQPDGRVSLIDMDSIEVIENQQVLYPASAHTPEFAPWESLQIGKDLIPENWDRFSLAINIYKLLFGVHPFTGTCKAPYESCNNVEQLIQNGLFPFLKEKYFEVIPPPHKRFLQSDLEIQNLFLKCFDMDTPAPQRPTAMNWCETLLPYARMVLNTPKIEEEQPKKKVSLNTTAPHKRKNKTKSTLAIFRKKPNNKLPYSSTSTSWWAKFVRIQNRITPELIMLFLLVFGGLAGISANYFSAQLQEIKKIQNQKSYELFVKEGVKCITENKHKEAILSFTNALIYKPQDKFAYSKLCNLKKQEYLKTGEQFFLERKYADAVGEYDRALDVVPNDSLVLARRADAIFADASENGDIASQFDIKLKIKRLPNYLYTNCSNEIFITAYDLGQHFQPDYEVEGARLVKKDKKGRIILIPTAKKVIFKFKNKDVLVQTFHFEAIPPPVPTISITPHWRGGDSPFLSISANAPTNFSAYYRSDATYKVSKWRLAILRNERVWKTKTFAHTLINSQEFNKLYNSETERLSCPSDKWSIEILEIVRRNYAGKYEPVNLQGIKTNYVYNQYFEEIW
ncbi:MAG: hypothetical protein MUE81_10335 [Thermoflexibacter sp.]|nr:hypothetical protein [Thermoflexibacter sp.]